MTTTRSRPGLTPCQQRGPEHPSAPATTCCSQSVCTPRALPYCLLMYMGSQRSKQRASGVCRMSRSTKQNLKINGIRIHTSAHKVTHRRWVVKPLTVYPGPRPSVEAAPERHPVCCCCFLGYIHFNRSQRKSSGARFTPFGRPGTSTPKSGASQRGEKPDNTTLSRAIGKVPLLECGLVLMIDVLCSCSARK